MAYRIAGINVHKKMLAVVVADVEVEGEHDFLRQRFGSNSQQLRQLSAWLNQHGVEVVVMESKAQYWQPVWGRGSGTGGQSVKHEKGQARCRERCICAGPLQSWAQGTEERFPGCRALDQAPGSSGTILSFVPPAE